MRVPFIFLPAVLSLLPLAHGLPHQSDLSRRSEAVISNVLAADNQAAADAASIEAAIDAELETLFSDEAAFPPLLEINQRKVELNLRAERVREAFLHSWNSYKAKGLPQDELRPVSGTPYSTRFVYFHTGVEACTYVYI